MHLAVRTNLTQMIGKQKQNNNKSSQFHGALHNGRASVFINVRLPYANHIAGHDCQLKYNRAFNWKIYINMCTCQMCVYLVYINAVNVLTRRKMSQSPCCIHESHRATDIFCLLRIPHQMGRLY